MGKMSINSDDLKYGIECCIKYMACSPAEECCDLCPYHGRCSSLEKDALAMIQQLEAENAELLEKIKQLERERDAAVRDCARFPCYTCNERENGDFCPQCRTTGTFRTLHEWRGPCEENGGQKEEEK